MKSRGLVVIAASAMEISLSDWTSQSKRPGPVSPAAHKALLMARIRHNLPLLNQMRTTRGEICPETRFYTYRKIALRCTSYPSLKIMEEAIQVLICTRRRLEATPNSLAGAMMSAVSSVITRLVKPLPIGS